MLGADEAVAWVDGYLAFDLVELSEDPGDLDRPGWWAVVGEFEGRWHLARFARVERPSDPIASLGSPGLWQLGGVWYSTMSAREYCEGVERLREAIASGEVYQANLTRTLSTDCDGDMSALAVRLAKEHPAPFSAFIRIPGIEVVSASPERYLERDADRVCSSPIKGTASAPAGLTEKDRAENIMIVDLVRHDLAQVTRPGTVIAPRLLDVEEHPGLVHLVSDVHGELRPEVTWPELLRATFPPGSVTGAPKSSALRLIAALEAGPRGPYCGAIGWVNGMRGRLGVGIRTFFRRSGEPVIHFGVGSGITWSSNAAAEWNETRLKAHRLVGLAGGVWNEEAL